MRLAMRVILVTALILSLVPGAAYGMRKHFGRAAEPATGAAVPGAKILVLGADTDKFAPIFADSAGKTPLKNPIHADAAGRYSFYAPNGTYRLQISAPSGKLLYDLDDISIVDPREPRTILATEQQPALSLHTLAKVADVNLPLLMERRNENDALMGAGWRVQCQMTELGWNLGYNFRRKGGASQPADRPEKGGFANMHFLDLPKEKEPSLPVAFGTNDADDGIIAWPGLTIFGGGAWTGGHFTSMNIRLAMPKGKDAIGIAVRMAGPKGLSVGDVVALDTKDSSRVAPVTTEGAKLPFVVAKADETGVSVLVRGLAWIKVDGTVQSGDKLVASAKSGQAKADNNNSDPSRSLGFAVTNSAEGWVLARIQRVGTSTER